MNLWTIPLRISLTCLLVGVTYFTVPATDAVVAPHKQSFVHLTLGMSYLFGILAIWCWGRK